MPAFKGADPHHGQGIVVDSYTVGLGSFARNEAYAVPNGLTIWWVCTEFETPRDGCSSLVQDFRVWHHHRWGYFAYETNQMTLDGFVHRGDPDVLTNPHENPIGMFLVDYAQRRTVIRHADIQGAGIGIVAPVNRDVRGSSGPEVGITRVEDSLINAGLGISIAAPWSVNGSANLAPQTTILRNVRFEYPATRQDAPIGITPDGGATTNLNLRNDVWIHDYDRPPGQNGDDLYIIPAYQPASRCDDTIGVCAMDITAQYPELAGVRVFPLR